MGRARIIGQAAPARVAAPLPVTWLEGDVLAEYVRFLAEAPEAAPPPVPGSVKWLEGDVLAEYVRFLAEAPEAAPAPVPGSVKWLEGDVLADFLQFLGEEDECAEHGGGGGGSEFMEEDDAGDDDDEEEEMAQLLPHIMSIPAVMARAAAPTSWVQESGQLVTGQESWL